MRLFEQTLAQLQQSPKPWVITSSTGFIESNLLEFLLTNHQSWFDIIQSIRQLHGTKTLIIITHRLSTIQHCDIILKLENGSIVRSGSFQGVVAL